MLPPLEDGCLAAALCACVRPKMAGDVGPREIIPTDAEREELRLAEDLAASGRRAKDFVAVTAARVSDPEAVVRRSAWRVFRCSELDGFPASTRVHYGQHLQFGLPSVDDASSEILLSCEPPSRSGGIGAPYLILGRFVDFGYVCHGRRSWNTAFTLVPTLSSAGAYGDPVDLRCGMRIVPIAPFSYLHGPRLMQACGAFGYEKVHQSTVICHPFPLRKFCAQLENSSMLQYMILPKNLGLLNLCSQGYVVSKANLALR